MAYTVLARKYRSWTFDELVGQEAVATTLKNAITSGRIHHGYLFCGTRGVGKTSAARILARSLNCLASEAPTVDPCRKCEACVAIAEGQDIDVIEIDAASHTGVDNIRELRGNTIYRLREGIERFFITDINNAAASATGQSQLAVMWDNLSSAKENFNHVPGGANVLYMDGHVAFVRSPGDEFPVNPYMAFLTNATL